MSMNNMPSSFYIMVDSDNAENLEYFPDNQPCRFKVRLVNPLNLTCTWKMALSDVFIADNSKTTYTNHLYIFCSIAGDSILNGRQQQTLLRKLGYVKKGNWTHTYNLPYYVDVNRTHIFDIEFYITDKQFQLASFLKKPSSVTLHLRSYPYFA